MEVVIGVISALVGVAAILNAIFLWFPPAPADGDATSAAGRKLVIRGIGVFGIFSVIISLKMFGVF